MPQLTLWFLLFTAIVVGLYWLIPDNRKILFLAICSSIFLIYLDRVSFAILLSLSALVYFQGRARMAKRELIILMILFTVFGATRLFQLHEKISNEAKVLVVIGFGFYMLKLVHYVTEQSANAFRDHTFLDFYAYMFFFPTMLIGPINRFDEFLQSERRLRWNEQMFADGLKRILYGYVKFIVIANWFFAKHFHPYVFHLHVEPAISVVLQSVAYGFHLFFAFAGMSDVAIGISLLLGYNVGENFDSPFLKKNLGEFWQSWHISLSSWCRQYVFLPLFAKSKNLPLALILTMLTIGLWHEFSIRYVLWGLYHAAGIFVWRLYQRHLAPAFIFERTESLRKTGVLFSTALTFTFVMIGFTIPRSASWHEIVLNFRMLMGGTS